jgi:hypothetical protein
LLRTSKYASTRSGLQADSSALCTVHPCPRCSGYAWTDAARGPDERDLLYASDRVLRAPFGVVGRHDGRFAMIGTIGRRCGVGPPMSGQVCGWPCWWQAAWPG